MHGATRLIVDLTDWLIVDFFEQLGLRREVLKQGGSPFPTPWDFLVDERGYECLETEGIIKSVRSRGSRIYTDLRPQADTNVFGREFLADTVPIGATRATANGADGMIIPLTSEMGEILGPVKAAVAEALPDRTRRDPPLIFAAMPGNPHRGVYLKRGIDGFILSPDVAKAAYAHCEAGNKVAITVLPSKSVLSQTWLNAHQVIAQPTDVLSMIDSLLEQSIRRAYGFVAQHATA